MTTRSLTLLLQATLACINYEDFHLLLDQSVQALNISGLDTKYPIFASLIEGLDDRVFPVLSEEYMANPSWQRAVAAHGRVQ